MAPDKKRAQEAGARLAFIDESGFSTTPFVKATWSPRGITPVFKHCYDRQRVNTIASIDCKVDGTDADVMFYMLPENVESLAIIDYLEALHREIPGKIVLIWDNLPAHKSDIVKEHIKSCSDWLCVHRFPAYAPELNPVEYLFSSVKTKDTANFPADSKERIADKLEQAVDRLADNQEIIQGFLQASKLF